MEPKPPPLMSAEQAQEACRRVFQRAAEGRFDLGNARVRVREFAAEGLRLFPGFFDPELRCLSISVRYRDLDNATVRLDPFFEVPDLAVGIVYLDGKDFTYRVVHSVTPEAREQLVTDTQRLMSEMSRTQLEAFTLRMVGRLNRVAADVPVSRVESTTIVTDLDNNNVRETVVSGPGYFEVRGRFYVEGPKPDQKWILMNTCHLSEEQADARLAEIEAAAVTAIEEGCTPKEEVPQ